jgi:6-pyruvoyl-tetrahydropterin synthase
VSLTQYLITDGIPSTTENLAIFIWNELKKDLGSLLYEVTLCETENNVVRYRGE